MSASDAFWYGLAGSIIALWCIGVVRIWRKW